MAARYAIYFIPEPETALANLGSSLLGRDSETGRAVPQPVFEDFSKERLYALTTDARRYGLHATLKAPFFLKQGVTERELLHAAACFTEGRQAIALSRLKLVRFGSFFALVPSRESPEERQVEHDINTLAAGIVSFFEPFRAALSEEEYGRRNLRNLSPRQRALLTEWGYPYVFDEYRFHITLTDRLRSSVAARAMKESLRAYLATARNTGMAVSGICVCKQMEHDQGRAFMLLQRLRF